jgi:hypothetical protein
MQFEGSFSDQIATTLEIPITWTKLFLEAGVDDGLAGWSAAAEMGRSLETVLQCSSHVSGMLSAAMVVRPHSVAKGIKVRALPSRVCPASSGLDEQRKDQ